MSLGVQSQANPQPTVHLSIAWEAPGLPKLSCFLHNIQYVRETIRNVPLRGMPQSAVIIWNDYPLSKHFKTALCINCQAR